MTTSDTPRHIPQLAEFPLPEPFLTAVGTRLVRGIVYHEPGLGTRPLELDVHLPPSGARRSGRTESRCPVVVFVHGGAFLGGTRTWAGPMYDPGALEPFATVARAGIAVASIDYRLSGEAPWPAQRDDGQAAIAWLRRRGPELGLDPERIAVWGESAGGHLAAILALQPGDDAAHAVRAGVPWYPLTDLPSMLADRGLAEDTVMDRGSPEARLLGGSGPAVAALAQDASPVTHVHAGAPPFLLLHGTADESVPHAQSVRLRDALSAAGAEAQLHTYEGSAHVWRDEPEVAADALRRTVRFLVHHLASGTERSVQPR